MTENIPEHSRNFHLSREVQEALALVNIGIRNVNPRIVNEGLENLSDIKKPSERTSVLSALVEHLERGSALYDSERTGYIKGHSPQGVEIRSGILVAIGNLGWQGCDTEAAVKPLLNTLQRDPSLSVRKTAAETLLYLTDRRSLPEIKEVTGNLITSADGEAVLHKLAESFREFTPLFNDRFKTELLLYVLEQAGSASLRSAVLDAFERAGVYASGQAALVADKLRQADSLDKQALFIFALGAIGPEAKSQLHVIFSVLADSSTSQVGSHKLLNGIYAEMSRAELIELSVGRIAGLDGVAELRRQCPQLSG
ncbi:MAG: hypothetical protein D6719_10020 [Candidatus Dadabacteria bacterium]|nr:MAG: hypothetical protein D6719_10020 [Candidatus Dadabacteria bacterium]